MAEGGREGVVVFTLLCVFAVVQGSQLQVTEISPSEGSRAGGVRLTVHGKGFVSNFNLQNNPNAGTIMRLVGVVAGGEYPCDLHFNGVTSVTATCYTRPMPEGVYKVKVTVNSVDITDLCSATPSHCLFTVSDNVTPKINSLTPRSGVPGTLLSSEALLFTSRASSDRASENGRSEKITRVYVAGKTCNVKDLETGEFYGLGLYVNSTTGEKGNAGYLKCKPVTDYIANYNLTFLVEGPYGRSMANPDVLRVHKNGIAMYQMYTDIEGVSASTGSNEGGQRLTVTGRYFDGTVSAPQVYVGEQACVVEPPFTSTSIVCLTPAAPASSSQLITGNRGVTIIILNGTSDYTTANWEQGTKSRLDETSYELNGYQDHVIKMEGAFLVPETGSWRFYLRSKTPGKLIVSNSQSQEVFTLESSTWSGNGEESVPLTLAKDSVYQLTVMTGSTGDSAAEVWARHFDTNYLASQTGNARPEIQNLVFTTLVESEVQSVTVTTTGTVEGVSTELRLTITGDLSQSFVVGLHGVFTEPLSASQTDGEELATALNELPSLSGHQVTVTDEQSSNTHEYTITFPPELGDVDSLEAKGAQADSNIVASIQTVTTGQSTLSAFRLQFGDNVTDLIDVSATPEQVETALKTSVGVRCHPKLSSGKVIADCESEGSCRGNRVSYAEPFCGRFSAVNPWAVYWNGNEEDEGYSLDSSNRILCMGLKGPVGEVWIRFKYKDTATEFKTDTVKYSVTSPLNRWGYSCENVLELVSDKQKGKSGFSIQGVGFYRTADSSEDFFVDQVVLYRENTVSDLGLAYKMRMPPLRPNGAFIKDIRVAGSVGDYTITIDPHLCANSFPLLALHQGSGSPPTQSEATYTVNSGGKKIQMVTERVTAASLPVGGSFSGSFNGQSTTPITVTPETETEVVRDAFSLIVGYPDVTRHGDCSAFNYTITMATKAGDQPAMTINTAGLTGTDVAASVVTVEDGSLWFRPIPGDMLATVHSSAQVKVYINNIPTGCAEGVDCSYGWSNEYTPTIASITPTSGGQGTTVTITGTKFDDSNNEVTIGGAECTVTLSSATSLTCILAVGPSGAQPVQVRVPNKGLASGSLFFTFTASVGTLSPTSASTEGGITLTITGQGFASGATVSVDDTDCPILSSSVIQIICTVPARLSAVSGPVTVTVNQGDTQLISPVQFSYSLDLTPVVTAVSLTSASAWGGQPITIDGTGFGDSSPDVTVNGKPVELTSNSDTQLVGTLPPLNPGSYPVRVHVYGKGLADIRTNSIPNIIVMLTITGMSPPHGSMFGGTRLTVTGQGFGSSSERLEVMVGNRTCVVESVLDTQLVCVIEYVHDTHIVTNQGVHKDLPKGYAYEPKQLTIPEGDCIHWQWTTPTFVSGIAYGIFQTASDSSKDTLEGGFRTPGNNTANGQYEFCFNVPGDYYYWSGYVNSPFNTLYLKGQVTVTSRHSSIGDLEVKVGGISAQHNTASGASSTSDGSCAGDVSLISGCSATVNPSPSSSSTFQFVFHECSTPRVSSISNTTASTLDTLTFAGSGFGGVNCQNEITYGGMARGMVSTSSGNQLSFKIDKEDTPPMGTLAELTLRVGNRGNALFAITKDASRRLALTPMFNSIAPFKGSLGGGTSITISGSGFASSETDVTVKIGPFSCVIQSVTPTQIVCLTPSSDSSQPVSIEVVTYHNGRAFPVTCRASFCSFIYDSTLTPTLTSFTPTSISAAPTTITLVGSGFGSSVSGVNVELGGVVTEVVSVTDTEIVCTAGHIPAGQHMPQVTVPGKGLAKYTNTTTLDSQPLIQSVSPTQGSVHGGTRLTITGHGFKSPSTVTLFDQPCEITSETPTVIECVTPSHEAADATLAVISNNVNFPSSDFSYAVDSTPVVSSVDPAKAQSGDEVTITGSRFSANAEDNKVKIGGVSAEVTSATETEMVVVVGSHVTGSFAVIVEVTDSGLSNDDIMFEYTLGSVNFSPIKGTMAGGQTLTVTSSGLLPGNTAVTICDEPCEVVPDSTDATQLLCVTPPSTATEETLCSLEVMVNSVSKSADIQYTYDPSITPDITAVEPARGGTAGGTQLIISGTGFGTSSEVVAVTIGGAVCDVTAVTETQITCTTNSAASGNYKVNVNVDGTGIASQTNADYTYIDVWSSAFTWGGNLPPVAGDMVVVPPGQLLLLDESSAHLSLLLIQGTLTFDRKDLELHADYIMITNGGSLMVGTETDPFLQNAVIMLHGHQLSRELPIYGSKTLAVREGTLGLYGRPTPITWTELASTAEAGDTQIVLTDAVNWLPGDSIVLPTTGHRHSQSQNEIAVISSVSDDGLTLTLEDPLTNKHVVVEETFEDGSSVALRGEVGLLSHNVKVLGSVHEEWSDTIEACPEGFDTGEFKTQTCFQGRFGEETGSDEHGAHIMVHGESPDTQKVVAQLSYIEMKNVGQAFRMGRYPVHMHLNGDMSKSYVRGLGIHESYNRAVNVHGTHNLLVEDVVTYNIMGGTFFLEDGIETNNTFRHNLAVFTRPSSSLRNDDITPSAFWITNPNNSIILNHAAGGSHFGFWYRMLAHPEGPSYDKNICPQEVPLNRFENNAAHSMGWFGLWIFEHMVPKVDGSCDLGAPSQAAKFETLTAWNCEKGAEWVNGGALQFKDFILVNNEKAAIEGKEVVDGPAYDLENGPLIQGGMYVAHLGDKLEHEGKKECTAAGVVLPYQKGLSILDINFYNFDRPDCAAFEFTRISGTCSFLCGGWTYPVSGLGFFNTTNKVRFAWESEGVLKDLDGSLTGTAGYSVIPSTPTLPPAKCIANGEFSFGQVPGSVCDDTVRFHRFSFNKISPSSLEYKDAIFTNQYGSSYSPFAIKRMTHKNGWSFTLIGGEAYELSFKDAEQLGNITYNGVFYDMEDGSIQLKQKTSKPDKVYVDGGTTERNMSDTLPSLAEAEHGEWFYDEDDGAIIYFVKGPVSKRRKRGAKVYADDVKVDFRAFRCYYEDCISPPDPAVVKISPERKLPWSDPDTWAFLNRSKPVEGDNVSIPFDVWMEIDEPLPPLDFVIVEGGLSVVPDASLTVVLDVNYIIVYGHFVVGWEHEPFNGSFTLNLRGSHDSPIYPAKSGPELGSKFMVIYGGLNLHGLPPNVRYTRLASTAMPGDTTLTLEETVNWKVGNEIMVTTTDADPWHTETFSVTSVSGNTIGLNDSVSFKHIAHSETLASGQQLKMTARVALLSRNIVIQGGDYAGLYEESYGARLVVGTGTFRGDGRIGFAKIENVEFYHTGQEGWMDSYDPRFSVIFMDVISDIDTDYYSYLRSCAFHHGFSPAVGVVGVENLEVSDNVMHHTIYNAFVSWSKGTRYLNNLMALNIWSGTYQDRQEGMNIRPDAAVEVIDATDLVMRGNIVAGSERVGFHVAGQECSTASGDLWSGNEGHSCHTGVAIFSTDSPVSSTCTLWSDFFVWKNYDWGLYLFTNGDIQVQNLLSAENGVGVIPYVIGPNAVQHLYKNQSVTIRDSKFVGRTTSYDWSVDGVDKTLDTVTQTAQARSSRHGTNGMSAIYLPGFVIAGNNAPEKPWSNSMSYNAIMGVMHVQNVAFEHFNSDGEESRDFIFSTNPSNEDMQHPVHTSDLSLTDVDGPSRVFFHNSPLRSINPSDCVDMDCDGLKKALVVDQDGSLLGHAGYVLPNAGFEWDGDSRRGIGDYRIPKTMLTAADGSRIDTSDLCPYKGIYNYANCTWVTESNAYWCDDSVDYRILMIESMDEDSETRRLSPIAVYSGGYVDLLNGPQDHGWCSGYTCRKRVSLFPAIVPLGRWVNLFLSSTMPEHMRFMLLNAAEEDCVALSIYKRKPYRLEILVDGQVIMPLNEYKQGDRILTKAEEYPNQFMPSFDTHKMGANYLRFRAGTLYWMHCGSQPLEIKMADVLIVSFGLPAMTNEEFFGEQIVNNLAQFLAVPLEKVRVVDVIRETGSGRRRKRQTGTTYFHVEIGTIGNDTTPDVDLAKAAEKIVTQVQLFGMDGVLNTTVLYTAILEPSAGPEAVLTSLKKADRLVLVSQPVGGKEGQPFVTQPSLTVLDPNGNPVEYLGALDSPWQVEVTIRSGGSGGASVTGNSSVTFVNGTAQFSGLGLSVMGSYILDFNITHPPEAAGFSIQSVTVLVTGRSVRVSGEMKSTRRITNTPLQLSFHLVDSETGDIITDIQWRDHTWTVSASILSSDIYKGQLSDTTSTTFEPSTGKANFYLQLDRSGVCPVLFTIVSNPPDYNVTVEIEVDVKTEAQLNLMVEQTSTVELKIETTYDESTAPYLAAIVRNLPQFTEKDEMVVNRHTYRRGSVIVSLEVQGTKTGVNESVTAMCTSITNGTTFSYAGTQHTLAPYMMVDGQTYYGVSCGPKDDDDDDDDDDHHHRTDDDEGLHAGIIAAVVIAAVAVVVVVVIVIVWYFKIYPKTKTYDTTKGPGFYLGHKHDPVEDLLFREDTFSSLRSRHVDSPLPPVTTNLSLKDSLPPLPVTPSPYRGGPSRGPTPIRISPEPSSLSTQHLAFAGPKY